MSDEELERLAAEMKNIKPSDKARQRGMDAALKAYEAAFDAEFVAEAAKEKSASGEKTSESSQGSADGPRPTGQTTRIARRETLRSKTMSKFNMTPKAAMMLASCAAALTVTMVVLPQSQYMPKKLDQKFETVAAEIGTEEIAATGSRQNAPAQVKPADKAATPSPVAPAQPQTELRLKDGGPSAAEAESDSISSANKSRADEFRQNGSPQTSAAVAPKSQMNLEYVDIKEAYVDDIFVPSFEPSNNKFETYDRNPITSVKEAPVSTFSIDVDTASYSFFRSSINRGQLPPPSAIRLEEMINYFPYDYEAPKSADEPFKANVTVTPTPWNADTKLMHIGIKGYVPTYDEKPRSNIVLLIDTSGSMNQPNKLPLLINSFKLLLNTLDDDDTVSIVTYAGSAGTVLEPTPASNKREITAAFNRLRAGGSTAGAAGLELAYNKAQENFDDEGINRVILATDGDFNVGFSSPDEMKTFITKKRKSGIFLSVLGFGQGNYNDHLMQSLAQNGNGVAAYIDSLAEANKVLADEAGSALITIAKDVKIQVEFNPATIAEYRLIGYETRALKREDFNNDAVDAGEINSGHSVTAIYEMTPVGSRAVTIDDLRYTNDRIDINIENGSDEYAFVKIRHKLPRADKSTLQTFPIGEGQERRMRQASDDMRFATAVAAVGQKLRGDSQLDDFSYASAIKLANGAKGEDENGYRAEFIQLVRLMETMEQ